MVTIQRVGEAWQTRAACRGPQSAAFFPPTHAERKEDKQSREARAKRNMRNVRGSKVMSRICDPYS